MIETPEIDLAYPLTDGDIAVKNLESARQRMWSLFWHDSLRPRIAEAIVEQEQFTLQFLGDPMALDRLGMVTDRLDRVDAESPRTALIHAQVASAAHRFTDAKNYLARVSGCTELSDAANRLSLSIDQACGENIEVVLEAREKMASKSGRLEDLVPLGALRADLHQFGEADNIYQRALREYQNCSPFGVAWVCFQLGVLWGELVPEARLSQAEYWYLKAIEYLPRYVKARIHLAEVYLECGRTKEAEALLLSATPSSDPEVHWRLADVLAKTGRFVEAQIEIQTARFGFEALLQKHLLAFADHGAEFYSGSGNDATRAFELATLNLVNRPTLRAFEQAHEAAVAAGQAERAAKIVAAAEERWGAVRDLRLSKLSETHVNKSASRGGII